jgi:hypothetical protein
MAQMQAPPYGARTAGRGPSGWVTGFTIFAAVMMIVTGVFQGLSGLATIIRHQFYVVSTHYVYHFNATGWGWVHLALGIVLFCAGFAVLSGKLWARAIGIFFAALSAVANFLFLPYSPIWALLIIAMDVFVMWALANPQRSAV